MRHVAAAVAECYDAMPMRSCWTSWGGGAALLCSVLAVTGCGLISSDITDFDLSLPPKEFTIDTAQWEIQSTDATFPAVDCSQSSAVCTEGATRVCTGAVCFAACGEGDLCEMTILVQLWHTVNLAVEKPELSTIEGQPLVSVTIHEMWYDVLENSMTVDSPELGVYVAPANVMSFGSPQALKVGTIAPITSMMTVEGGQLDFEEQGQEHLKQFMKDYTTPFNIIVGTSITVKAGDPIPQGLLRAEVNVRATAGI